MPSRHSTPPRLGSAELDGPARDPRQTLLVGRQIRKLRKERRLDQAALAALVGLQPVDVAGIEKGEYRMSLDVLLRLLAVFEADVADLSVERAGAAAVRPVPFGVRAGTRLPPEAI
jgi:transcriptional regulator with XRE-family HTH domain